MPIGTCRLCGIQADLQLSHVIPAVIYRWMRDTSGNSYLRFGAQPNKRAQDGNKFYWLCQSCEARLSRCEDIFARRIFHPYIKDSGLRMRYGPWLLQFGASLVWRVLKWHEEQGLAGYPEDKRPFLFAAEKVWREFLLGSTRNPGAFEVHLLPVEGLEKGSHADFWPPTIDRYFMRTIETDVAHGRNLVLVLRKFPVSYSLALGAWITRGIG